MVTGASGRLGARVTQELAGRLGAGRVVATARRRSRAGPVAIEALDLRDRDAVVARVRATRPGLILHLGAAGPARRSEACPDEAPAVDVLGTEALRAAADDVGAAVALASTDLVFDGAAGPYGEGDAPRPATHRGRTRRLAELVLDAGAAGSPHLVVRLPPLFGGGGPGGPAALDADALLAGSWPVADAGEARSPLSLGRAAHGFVELALRGCTGVVHLAGVTPATHAELLGAYAAALGVASPHVEGRPAAPAGVRDASLRIDRLRAEAPDLVPPPLPRDVADELARAGGPERRARPAWRGRRPAVVAPPGPPAPPPPAPDARRAADRRLTVIVPARQAAAHVGRCLAALGTQAFVGRGALHVVVACNGCTDGTPDLARRWAAPLAALGVAVDVLDLPSGGRAGAFNAGDRLAGPGPRAYVDADVVLSPGALDELADALGAGAHFAAPRVAVQPPRSAVSRGYAQLWAALPYVVRTGATMGVYAVSEEGRRRWGEFPSIHSDDKFARLHFAAHERAVLPSATYRVDLPDGARDLYRARVRYERGNRELAERFPALLGHDAPRYAGLVAALGRRPRLWPAAASVGIIQGSALLRVRTASRPALAGPRPAPAAAP